MKLTVKDLQRAFLFKNGRFQKMLLPGEHNIRTLFGYHAEVIDIDDQNLASNKMFDFYMQDEEFRKSTAMVDIPEGFMAVQLKRGNYKTLWANGARVAHWNVFGETEYVLLDMKDDSSIEKVPTNWLSTVKAEYAEWVKVDGFESVLFFENGRFVRELEPGKHFFWKYGARELNFYRYDKRTQQIDLNGQEILTADKIALRLNVGCQYRIADARKIQETVHDYFGQIYMHLQLTLREWVGQYRFDDLLEKKSELSKILFEEIRKKEDTFAVEFLEFGVKDIILPGEIRDIMNTVLLAEKRAQANVITRREEVASTRSLLNTAKLLDENKTLLKLKELEYLERICDKVGNISVSNAGGLIDQLSTIVAGAPEK